MFLKLIRYGTFFVLVAVMLLSMLPTFVAAQEKTLTDSVARYSAQANNESTLCPLVPTSPQAEAFQRMGEYKVNNSSGIPDISIPLLELEHFGYKIPMNLRYEAMPLKPGYHYDVVGYGWALSGNSCVSRTINSQPDETFGFTLSKSYFDKYIGLAGSDLNKQNLKYDKNGNLVKDLNKKICKIEYNVLNLPTTITFEDGNTISYIYDKDGTKRKVIHKSASPSSQHVLEYRGNMVYEDNKLKLLLVDGGYVSFEGNVPVYHFYLDDHLGNKKTSRVFKDLYDYLIKKRPYEYLRH